LIVGPRSPCPVLTKVLSDDRTKAHVRTNRVRAIGALAKLDPEADPVMQLEPLKTPGRPSPPRRSSCARPTGFACSLPMRADRRRIWRSAAKRCSYAYIASQNSRPCAGAADADHDSDDGEDEE
jgi:hypothetical protein